MRRKTPVNNYHGRNSSGQQSTFIHNRRGCETGSQMLFNGDLSGEYWRCKSLIFKASVFAFQYGILLKTA
jgi:hypothetical protein